MSWLRSKQTKRNAIIYLEIKWQNKNKILNNQDLGLWDQETE